MDDARWLMLLSYQSGFGHAAHIVVDVVDTLVRQDTYIWHRDGEKKLVIHTLYGRPRLVHATISFESFVSLSSNVGYVVVWPLPITVFSDHRN